MSEASELVMLIKALDTSMQHCALLEYKLREAKSQLDKYEGIHVDDVKQGHGTKTSSGRCGSAITPADLRKKFCDSYLGCAGVTIDNGSFTITAYTD